jgi:hypothetical protein
MIGMKTPSAFEEEMASFFCKWIALPIGLMSLAFLAHLYYQGKSDCKQHCQEQGCAQYEYFMPLNSFSESECTCVQEPKE